MTTHKWFLISSTKFADIYTCKNRANGNPAQAWRNWCKAPGRNLKQASSQNAIRALWNYGNQTNPTLYQIGVSNTCKIPCCPTTLFPSELTRANKPLTEALPHFLCVTMYYSTWAWFISSIVRIKINSLDLKSSYATVPVGTELILHSPSKAKGGLDLHKHPALTLCSRMRSTCQYKI